MADDEPIHEWAAHRADEHFPAMKVLLADGMPAEMAADVIVAAIHHGMDTMDAAQHLVGMRKAFRGEV